MLNDIFTRGSQHPHKDFLILVRSLHQGVQILTEKIFWLSFLINEKYRKCLCALGIDDPKSKTIPLWNGTGEKCSSWHHCMTAEYMHLQYWALSDDLVVF